MSSIVTCPDCGANLRIADQHLGKAIRCPKCRQVIETQAPELVASENIVAVLPPQPAAPRAPFAPRPKKRRFKKKEYEPRVPVRTLVGLGIGGFCFVLAAAFAYWFLRYGFHFRMPGIPDSQWQALEIPNRVRVRLPGAAQQVTQPIAGMTMIMHQCQPDKNSIYAVAYMEGELPAQRRALPVETLLNDSCNGSVANLAAQGGVEESRKSIQLGPHPGKELVVDMPKADGKMISRVFIVNSRLYIVMAGGFGLRSDHENVKRLFDSFEILENPGDPSAPAGAAGAPAVAGPAGAAGPAGPGGSPKPSESSQPPFQVDPKLMGEWTEVYLSDMTEFDVQMGEWKFGKNGDLGYPHQPRKIEFGRKYYLKGLGMHPQKGKPVRARYALGKQAAKFETIAAIGGWAGGAASKVTFEVVGDNKVLWTSKPIQEQGESQECKVDVSSVSILELRVTVSGSDWNAPAVWLDPKVLKK